MADRLALEMDAHERFMNLLKDGVALRDFCKKHGVSIPERLSRFLGDQPPGPSTFSGETTTGSGSGDSSPKMTYPPMPHPERPPQADTSWIWIPEHDATVISLVLAWLRQATKPMTPADIFVGIEGKRPTLNKGSIANLGTKLVLDGSIRRDDDGWTLVQVDLAPVLYKGYLWGEPLNLEKTELAAHRRYAIRHILGVASDGFQIMQVTNVLKGNCPWLHPDIPVSKDLIKADIQELLETGVVRRCGNSGKWELAK